MSTTQNVATVVVFDYLVRSGDATAANPKPLPNAEIRCTLQYDRANAQSPLVSLAPKTEVTSTDANGYWQFNLVPNASINPTGTLYTIQTPYSTFQISVAASPATQQASTILANAVSNLPPATTNLVGPLTVAGDVTASSVHDSGLVAGQVAFPAGGGLLTGDPGLSWDNTGKALTATSGFFKGQPSFDVKAYGAKGDGVTDDTTAIQAALTAANTGVYPLIGGTVYLPRGTYMVSAQLVVPFRVAMVGAGRDTTTIKALGTFPSSTAVVWLGDKTGNIGMGCRVENMTIDASGITGSIGIYSERINEQSGVFRTAVYNALAFGVQIKQPGAGNGAQNYTIDDLEVLWPNSVPLAGTIGLAIDNTSVTLPPRVIQRVSVVANAGHALITAIRMDGAPCRVSDIHVEQCTNGLLVGSVANCSGGVFVNLTCVGATTTNLLVFSNATTQGGLFASGLVATGASTNVLVDQLNGITIADFTLRGSYLTGDGGANAQTIITTSAATTQRFTRVKMLKDLQRSWQVAALGGGTVTIDATAGEIVVATLSASTTIAISNATVGQKLILRIQHDGTANAYTITWPATVRRAGGSFPNTNSANAQDILALFFDGTNWLEEGRALNLG